MGLDMYLLRANREEKQGYDNLLPEVQITVTSPWDEVGYWRKANHIRDWFVKKHDCHAGDECEFEVTKEELEELKNTCEKVLVNPELAEELLPRSEGFFFGSQEYDIGYFQDLEDTICICLNVINNTNWAEEVVEYVEWW